MKHTYSEDDIQESRVAHSTSMENVGIRLSLDWQNRKKAQYLTRMEKKSTSKKPDPKVAADVVRQDNDEAQEGPSGQPQAGDEKKGKKSLSQYWASNMCVICNMGNTWWT